MFQEVDNAINEIKINNISNKTKKIINKLFFSYSLNVPENIDVILVLGSDSNHRILTTLNLYNNYHCKIICSGGSVTKGKYSESIRYKKILLKNKVLDSNILVEEKSTNTYENIINSLELIKKQFNSNIKILIISSNFHLPRIKAIVDRVLKQDHLNYSIYYYPSFSKKMKLDKWFKYKEARQDIILELEKLNKYYKEVLEDKLFF